MLSQVLLAALSGAALVNAQTPTTSPSPPTPSTTVGIPTIEGALTYDGPPVIGYTGLLLSGTCEFTMNRHIDLNRSRRKCHDPE
jgi:hypothetical protein